MTLGDQVRTENYWTLSLSNNHEISLEKVEMGHIHLFTKLEEIPLTALCQFLKDRGLPEAPVGMPRKEVEFCVVAIVQELWYKDVRSSIPESVENSRSTGITKYKNLVTQINQGETTMADAASKATKGTKAAKGTKKEKVKKIKTYLTVRYDLTAKDGKALLDPENKTHNAVIYRTLSEQKDAPTFEELSNAIDKRTFGSGSKAVETIIRWHVHDLRKKGFIKSTEKREEAEAAAA